MTPHRRSGLVANAKDLWLGDLQSQSVELLLTITELIMCHSMPPPALYSTASRIKILQPNALVQKQNPDIALLHVVKASRPSGKRFGPAKEFQ